MMNKEDTSDCYTRKKDVTVSYEELYQIIKKLRSSDGCPWDKEQTPLTMRSALTEETFEALDAIKENNSDHVREELGDIILNATMIAYMYEQQGDFFVAECIDDVCKKMIRRHPHVFSESEGKSCALESVDTADQVVHQWDQIKERIENHISGKSILDSIPDSFPPLLKAYKMQKKALKYGFAWNSTDKAYKKIEEELQEVQEASIAVKNSNDESVTEKERKQMHLEEEIGDLLFAVINYALYLGVDSVSALQSANKKFYNRFSYVEERVRTSDMQSDFNFSERLLELWNDAKKHEQV